MSMVVLVAVPKSSLPSVSAWQKAIDDAGFDLKLDPAVDPGAHEGFWPCKLHGSLSGFETFYEDSVGFYELDGVPDAQVGPCLAFEFGGWADEAMSANIAASVLAAMTGSTFIDGEAGTSHAHNVAIAQARTLIAELQGLYDEQAEDRKKRNGG